jgi:hypothetical protein
VRRFDSSRGHSDHRPPADHGAATSKFRGDRDILWILREVCTSTFTETEIEYLRGQLLGRLATVGRDGSPHVVPVGFRLGPRMT